MPNPARYADDAVDAIRRMLTSGGVVLPPPGAARAAAEVVIDPAIAARAARQAELPLGDIPAPSAPTHPGAYLDRMRTAHWVDATEGSRGPHNIFPDVAPLDPQSAPDLQLGSPLWNQMDQRATAYDNLLKGRTANLRNQPFAKPAQAAIQEANANSSKMRAAMEASAQRGELMQDVALIGAGVAGAGALGAGALALSGAGGTPEAAATPPKAAPPAAAPKPTAAPPKPAGDEPLTSTEGTADLASEARPAPAVQSSTDPREQAQELIAQLNQMRRQAGGEVPEAKQMTAEINRLLALSNQKRNATPPQQGASDPHSQAQALIAQLNEMRRKAGGEVPQAQQIMAEVRRLQAMGDQQRNVAQTR
jgi:hypothetical protein